MTHLVPCPEFSPTPSHMHMPSVKSYLCSINGHFSKTKAFCLINQNPLDKLRYSLVFTKSRVFLWYRIFGVSLMLRKPRHFYGLSPLGTMSDHNWRVFHPRGYLSILAISNTHIFHFLFLLCNCETHFGRCPILSSPPSNTKHSVDLSCTHDIPSNTKHSVDLYHAFTSMSCDVLCINAMQCYCMYIMLHAQ